MKKLILVRMIGLVCLLAFLACAAGGWAQGAGGGVAVGAQYDTTHVYVASEREMDGLAESFTAVFGGSAGPRGVANVTPVASRTKWEPVRTPVGSLSVFAFETAAPYPFGEERTGYLVTDMDAAVKAARAAGTAVVVAPFRDPIGMDAIVEWPGGVKMQLYWHFKAPSSGPLETIPENRVYVPAERADEFVRDWVQFAGGTVVEDLKQADGGAIGRAGESYRLIRIASGFGKMVVLVTDGHLPYPFGRETTGYEVKDLDATLTKAQTAGVKVLAGPFAGDGRKSVVVEFPGGYVAEIHALNAH